MLAVRPKNFILALLSSQKKQTSFDNSAEVLKEEYAHMFKFFSNCSSKYVSSYKYLSKNYRFCPLEGITLLSKKAPLASSVFQTC